MRLIFFTILSVFVIYLPGCTSYTEAPKPTNHAFSTQKFIQSAQHWENAAEEVSDWLVINFKEKDLPQSDKFINVQPFGNSKFEIVYTEYIKSKLTQKGFKISTLNRCPFKFLVKTNLVYHPNFPVNTGFKLDYNNKYNGLSSTEIIVSNNLYFEDEIILSINKTYYFMENEIINYKQPEVSKHPEFKVYEVTEK